MVRAIALLSAALCAVSSAASAMPVSSGHAGTWYPPASGGHGLVLEVLSPERAVASWYTFAADGTRVWIVADGAIAGDRIDFNAFLGSGGRFPGTPGNWPVTLQAWGTF